MYLELNKCHLWAPAGDFTNGHPIEAFDAICFINAAVDDKVKTLLTRVESAPKAWKILHNHYAGKSNENLLKSLSSLQNYVAPNNLSGHIPFFESLGRDIKCYLGGKDTISVDSLMALYSLATLPASYEPVRITLATLNPDVELTLEQIRPHLKHKDLVSSTNSNAHLAGSQITRCAHFHNKDLCWTCHPKLRPECSVCKAKNLARFYHLEGSSKCISNKSVVNSYFSNVSPASDQSSWIVDTGCSDTMTPNPHLITNRSPCHSYVKTASGDLISSEFSGQIQIDTPDHLIKLNNVLYVPGLSDNLLSVSSQAQMGNLILFDDQCGYTVPATTAAKTLFQQLAQKSFLTSTLRNGLYTYDPTEIPPTKLSPQASTVKVSTTPTQDCDVSNLSFDTWHRRFAHLNFDDLARVSSVVDGFHIASKQHSTDCSSCIISKSKRSTHKPTKSRATRIGDLTHVDLGVINVPSINGYRYYLLFVDDFSRFTTIHCISKKRDCADLIKSYSTQLFNKTGRYPLVIRSDNAKEFSTSDLVQWTSERGMKLQTSNAYTPEQNGVVERMNLTITSAATAMLNYSGFPQSFWEFAFETAVFVRNVSPTSCNPFYITPYELWHSKRPNVSNLRIFGEPAYVHVPHELRRKLDPKAHAYHFIGYSEVNGTKGWKFIDLQSHGIHHSCDVTFLKDPCFPVCDSQLFSPADIVADDHYADSEYAGSDADSEYTDATSSLQPNLSVPVDSHNADQEPDQTSESASISNDSDQPLDDDSGHDNPPPASPEPEHPPRQEISSNIDTRNILPNRRRDNTQGIMDIRRSLRAERLANRHPLVSDETPRAYFSRKLGQIAFKASRDTNCPQSVQEIEQRSDYSLWQDAMTSELQSLAKHNTFNDTVPLPASRQPISSKWVFRIKYNPDGSVNKYKARLVVRGFSQREGVDYHDTYAPVAHLASLRALLSHCASEDYHIDQCDVETAFLIPELDEDIWVKLPDNRITKLRKSLYGLKQAPRVWNSRIHGFLKKLGFEACTSDMCIYVRCEPDGTCFFIALYVDDLLLACRDRHMLDSVKAAINSEFKITDMGPVGYFLGFEIVRDRARRTLKLHQAAYTESILEKASMLDSKPLSTPANAAISLTNDMSPKCSADIDYMSKVPYRSLVGGLLYLVCGSRPDIAGAVSQVCRFVQNPGRQHWDAVKHILRYLQGTKTAGITLGGSQTALRGYVDSDWASDPITRRSRTGYIFYLHDGPISWMSKLQSTVALSSTEAEYMALSTGSQEAVWLRSLLRDMKIISPSPDPVIIYGDNQGSLKLAKNPHNHSRTKHIDVRHHFVRDLIEDKVINVIFCPTEQNTADLLTKALPPPLFDSHVRNMISSD